MNIRIIAGPVLLMVAVFLVTGWVVTRPIGYALLRPDYIVATTIGENECGASGDIALDSATWSGRTLIVEATQVFSKGPYEVKEPKYTVKGTHLYIGWSWSLPPGAAKAACRSGHKVHIEIGGLRQTKYSIHLAPMIHLE
jgi:hypothetical protein